MFLIREYLAKIDRENRIPRFALKHKYIMLAKFTPDPKTGGFQDNQYFYLYHLLMFFCAMYVRMSYHYFYEVLHYYAAILLVISALVCYKWRWNANLTWLYFFFIVLMQLMFDHLDLHLPQWFVLYPTIPMLLASIVENLMLNISSDPDTVKIYEEIVQRRSRSFEAPPPPPQTRSFSMKWKAIFIDMYHDQDLRYYYPIIFEVYMTACALFCIHGGGIMHLPCFADLYLVGLWMAFMYTEDKKKSGRPKMFKLPNPIVKVVFLLYAPPLFWINISALTLINIWMVSEHATLADKMTSTIALLFITVSANTFARAAIFDTCPFIEF